MVIQDLNMKFGKETAGSLMTTNFVTLPMDSRVDDAIDYLRGHLYQREESHYLYVLDNA